MRIGPHDDAAEPGFIGLASRPADEAYTGISRLSGVGVLRPKAAGKCKVEETKRPPGLIRGLCYAFRAEMVRIALAVRAG